MKFGAFSIKRETQMNFNYNKRIKKGLLASYFKLNVLQNFEVFNAKIFS